MTSLAIEHDPYILPLPGPDSPVVLPQWISSGNRHPNSRYRDPIWSLAPLIDNPGSSLAAIRWKHCPEPLLGQMKLTAWTMINGRLRPTYLQSRGAGARGRGAALSMRDTFHAWMHLARWLHERRITDFAGCTEDVWRAYISERWDRSVSRSRAEMICSHFSDLWAFDQLSAHPAGVVQPPWTTEGIDDFLPAGDGSARGENSTEPLDPQVLGPLLVWAIRFVDDFADDILTAWAEQGRLMTVAAANKASRESMAALADFLLPRIRSGAPLPAVRTHGRLGLACTYVSALTGASLKQAD